MIVEVRCEKCGTVVKPRYYHSAPRADGCVDYSGVYHPESCPTCNPPEPSYGLLTVEVVAKALWMREFVPRMSPLAFPTWDDVANHGKEPYRRQARMVIRAIQKIVLYDGEPPSSMYEDDPLAWLLSLGEKP